MGMTDSVLSRGVSLADFTIWGSQFRGFFFVPLTKTEVSAYYIFGDTRANVE
jgi:hypothetical protein